MMSVSLSKADVENFIVNYTELVFRIANDLVSYDIVRGDLTNDRIKLGLVRSSHSVAPVAVDIVRSSIEERLDTVRGAMTSLKNT